jgi:membrane protease YdiL (CAAX protease family)
MSDPQPRDKNTTPTEPPGSPDEPAPMDVLPVAVESTDEAAIPFILPVDPDILPVDPDDAAFEAYPAEKALTPRAPRPPHPGFRFAFLWCLAYQGLQLLTGIVVASVLAIISVIASAKDGMPEPNPIDAAKLEKEATVPSLVCGSILGILFALLVIRLIVGQQWQRRLALVRPGFIHLILAILALPGVMYLCQAAYQLALYLHFPTFEYQHYLIKIFSNLPWWFGVLVVGLAPAISEELLFRGFIGRGLVARYGAAVGVLLSSLLFGLIHLDPPHIAATFVMGVCFHYMYLMTRSLWVPMFMHFLNNSWGVIAMLGQDESLAHVDDAPPPYLIGAAAFLALAVAWAFYRSRARLIFPPDQDATAWKPAFRGVEAPPTGSGTQTFRPYPGWAPASATLLAIVAFVAAFVVALD